jgi:hypothetical protein
VAGDRAKHVARLGQEASPAVGDVHGLDAETELAELVLEPRPERHLAALFRLGPAGGLRGGVDGRHPHDAGTLARGDLDGERVHPANSSVERQRPDRLHAGRRT